MVAEETLIERVEKLERQNRRLKLIGFGLLLVAGTILLMGQTRHQMVVPGEIRARSFVLVNSEGKIRGELKMLPPNEPAILLYGDSDLPQVTLGAAEGLSIREGAGGSVLNASPVDGISLVGPHYKSGAFLTLSPDGPSFELDDANGFMTRIGISDLITTTTGESHRTSAASVVLFGKDHKVLWSAPPQ